MHCCKAISLALVASIISIVVTVVVLKLFEPNLNLREMKNNFEKASSPNSPTPFNLTGDAFGLIRNIYNPYICVDQEDDSKLGLSICNENVVPSPYVPGHARSQFFLLKQKGHIQDASATRCWSRNTEEDGVKSSKEVTVNLVSFTENTAANVCTSLEYDPVFQTIKNEGLNSCLTAIYSEDESQLRFSLCVPNEPGQRWVWGYVNPKIFNANI